MPFPLNENVNVQRDATGKVEHLEHFQQPFVGFPNAAEATAAADAGMLAAPADTPEALARKYLEEVAPVYGLTPSELPAAPSAGFAPEPVEPGSKLQLAEEKDMFDTTTVSTLR